MLKANKPDCTVSKVRGISGGNADQTPIGPEHLKLSEVRGDPEKLKELGARPHGGPRRSQVATPSPLGRAWR